MVGLLLVGIVGQYSFAWIYQPRSYEGYQLGLGLRQFSQPGDLVATVTDDMGDPVAIYYSGQRGWVFPPAGERDWSRFSDDDQESIQLLEGLRAEGADWFGLTGRRWREVETEHPQFAAYLRQTTTLIVERSEYVIFALNASVPAVAPVREPQPWMPDRFSDAALAIVGVSLLTSTGVAIAQRRRRTAGMPLAQRIAPIIFPTSAVQPPPISIIVCTRDRPESLRRCLQSLAHLDYPTYEVIVVDNASSDTAAIQAIVAAHEFRYLREERPGLNWARNRGAAEAGYSIVAYTDDDTEADAGWLRGLAAAFTNPQVAVVTGLVLPAEAETEAQQLFEQYSGMGKGTQARVFRRDQLLPDQVIAAHQVGVGANMAFRRQTLVILKGFDTALDVGTPAYGGGDIDIFHRALALGLIIRYEPQAQVRHYHRRDIDGLRRQIYSNGRSFGVYLLTIWQRETVDRVHLLVFAVRWMLGWVVGRVLRSYLGLLRFPPNLCLAELWGAIQSPWAYVATRRRDRVLHQSGSRGNARTWSSPAYLTDALTTLVRRELQIRYKGSMLGLLWAILSPLGTVVVLHTLFTAIVPLNIPNYAAFVYCGMLPWTWFQTAVQNSAMALIDNRDLVRKPFFPRVLLPAVVTGTNFILYLLALPVLLLLLLYEGVALSPLLLVLPIVWLVLTVFTLACSVLFAALGVVVRDVQLRVTWADFVRYLVTKNWRDPSLRLRLRSG